MLWILFACTENDIGSVDSDTDSPVPTPPTPDDTDVPTPAPPTPEPACQDDGDEDNDVFGEALAVPSGTRTVLEDDPDFWRFSLEPGESFRVDVRFDHSDGNIDLTVYDALYLPAGTSYSFTDDEAVEVQNTSQVSTEALIRVLLRDPGCNDYTVSVTALQ